ncbi:MAG: hypothetical protein H6566_19065 [Lewinellaceae bacterium]|nr:hypothetical protein [Lewinellaceae bacterium]
MVGGVRLSGFVFRMSPEGQLLWERRFINDATHLYADILLLDDICEAPDGRIAVVAFNPTFFPTARPMATPGCWCLTKTAAWSRVHRTRLRHFIPGRTRAAARSSATQYGSTFYPQPAGDWLTVNFDRDLPPRCRLLLHSALGWLEMEQPLTAGQQQATLDTSKGIPAYIYVLALATQDGQLLHTQKVLVNNK